MAAEGEFPGEESPGDAMSAGDMASAEMVWADLACADMAETDDPGCSDGGGVGATNWFRTVQETYKLKVAFLHNCTFLLHYNRLNLQLYV